jgi:hypothetical protein
MSRAASIHPERAGYLLFGLAYTQLSRAGLIGRERLGLLGSAYVARRPMLFIVVRFVDGGGGGERESDAAVIVDLMMCGDNALSLPSPRMRMEESVELWPRAEPRPATRNLIWPVLLCS